MIKQPEHINPSLWRRYLIKRGKDGIYSDYGLNISLFHTDHGTLEVIQPKSSRLFSTKSDPHGAENEGSGSRWV